MDTHLKNALSALIFVFLLCLATSALAGGPMPPAAAPYFDGFYAGLGGGVVSATSNVRENYNNNDPSNTLSVNNKMDLGKHGLNGNVFLGFGKTLRSIYLGGEVFGNVFNPEWESSTVGGTPGAPSILMKTKVKSPYSYGGDIRAGYVVSPRVMLYALFGLDYAKFEVKSNVNNPPNGGVTNNFNKWRLGYMPGVGIEVGLANHLSLRGQYTYTFYPSFSHSTTNTSGPITHTLNTKVDADRGLFTLMLSWLFN